jgi:hypothetical protein
LQEGQNVNKELNFLPASGQADQTPLGQIFQGLQAGVQGHGGRYVEGDTVRAMVALESADAGKRARLTSAVQDLRSLIANVRNTINGVDGVQLGELSIAQESAAVQAGLLASSPKDYLRAPVNDVSKLRALAQGQSNMFVVDDNDTNSVKSRPGLEAYDERQNSNAVATSVFYNMEASRQDPFCEAFFPTVTATHDSVGFTVQVRLNYIQDDYKHKLNGALAETGRTNILKAVVRPGLIRNDQTKLVPVVRDDGGENDSTSVFVADTDVAPTTVMIDKHEILTAPLKIGKKFNLLGLTQTEATLAAGVFDSTDAIDSSVRLSAIYVKLGAAAGNKVIRFSTLHIPTHEFNAAVQGGGRQLSLNFMTEALMVTSATKAVDGSDITALTNLADKTVRLGTNIFGYLIQDKGETQLTGSDVTVARVTDPAKQVLSLTSGSGLTIANVFAGAAVIGYDLLGYRTNSNRRQRGQLLDTQTVSQLYTIPLLPPLTALRPLSETEANDSARVQDLVTATRVLTSNLGVGALLQSVDLIRSFYSQNDDTLHQPEVLGAARFLVDCAFMEANVDIPTDINTLSSKDRVEDVQSVLCMAIRDMAASLHIKSALSVAIEMTQGSAASKPLVIIGTDPYTAQWLTRTGDTRLMGDQFTFKVVTTMDERMRNKIVLAFGQETAYNSQVPTPLHFGNMMWRPELTVMMPMPRNGGISHELTVSPSLRHVLNMPVAGLINVTGVREAVTQSQSLKAITTTAP